MENYINYFTEIEEHFWKKRGTALFLSTLDWALIDSWKEAKIPIAAVLKGIDRAFEKQSSRRSKVRKINSLAYCQQAILEVVQEEQRGERQHPSSGEPFEHQALADFFGRNAAALEKASALFAQNGRPESAATLSSIAASITELQRAAASEAPINFEETEQRLTVLEEKMFSTLQAAAEEQELVAIRAEMDRELAPVRQTMQTHQVELLRKQFLHRKLLEKFDLPRLSLFYL